MKIQKGFIKKILILVIIIAGISVLGGAGYFGVKQYKNSQNEKAQAQQEAEVEQKAKLPVEGNDATQYHEAFGETRYYAGTIGNQTVHLIYWPTEENNNHFIVSGKLVYDNISEKLIDVSIDFTSGGAMDGAATIDNKMIAEFTNRNVTEQLFVGCEKENAQCGEWTDASGVKNNFILTPSQFFKIEDFLRH